MLSLTSFTAPLAARTAFSMMGVNWRHGPHHGAQKSTRTGTSREASITSRMKSFVDVFLIRSASAAPAAPCERIGVSMLLSPWARDPIPPAWQRQDGRASLILPTKMGRARRLGNALTRSGEGQHERLMTAGTDETQEVGGGEPGGGGVLERMAIDLDKWKEPRIHHRGHASLAIVDQGKWRDRTGRHAEQFGEQLGIAEAQPPELEVRCQELEIDASIVLGDHKSCAPFFVGQEQILGMSARQTLAQRLRLLDGEHRLVLHRSRGDAEFGKAFEQSLAIRGHQAKVHAHRLDQVLDPRETSDAVKACGTSYGQRQGDQLQGPTVPSSANQMVLARARE